MKVLLSEIAYLNSTNFNINQYNEIEYLDTSSVFEGVFQNPQKYKVEEGVPIPSRAKRGVRNDTIVYSSVRPRQHHFGIINNPSNNLVVSSGFVTIDANREVVDPHYLYYVITQPKYIEAMCLIADVATSSYPSFRPEDLGNLEIDIETDIEKQRIIASYLSLIDRKIEVNNVIISTLDSMAKDIYDYWFVQFDFPDENGKPYKSSGGKMVWNEELKREIPEGWKVSLIENWCKIFTGKKDVNQSLDSGEYKFFSCAPSFRYSNEKIYSGKAILISGNGSYTGRTILVNDAFDLYQRTYACVMKDQLPDIVEYIYYTMKRFFVPKVIGGTHGSAIPYIVYNDIAKEKLVYEESVVKKFLEVIVQVQELISVLSKEINELSSLRDFLLPLLMNGQVKIGDMEA